MIKHNKYANEPAGSRRRWLCHVTLGLMYSNAWHRRELTDEEIIRPLIEYSKIIDFVIKATFKNVLSMNILTFVYVLWC